MAFVKATKQQARLRLAISGPPGSGKTYTALTLGKYLGTRMACIDTERGSASKYAGEVADFDQQQLEHFSVQNYLAAIGEAAAESYPVLLIDSLSHAWAGKGGVLEEVDKRGGKFDAWRHASPLQQQLVDTILSYPGHVICTMRTKIAYDVTSTERNGRRETKVEKLGLAPVQRDDLSYEFDVVFEMNDQNTATVSKSRCAALAGKVIAKPGEDVARALLAWLTDGAPAEISPADKLLEDIQRAKTLEERSRLGDTAKAMWSKLTAVQRELVTDEMRIALARIQQAIDDEKDAAAADEALRAQEAAAAAAGKGEGASV
jgi:hypothetical protein